MEADKPREAIKKNGVKRKVEARGETDKDVQKTLEMLKTGVRKQRRTSAKQTTRTRRKKPVVDTSDSDDCNYPERKAEKQAAKKRAAAISRAAGRNGPASKKRKKKKKSKKGRGQIKAVPGILTRGVSAKNQRENLLRDPDGTRVVPPDQRENSTSSLVGVAVRDHKVTPEFQIQHQQAERRKNRTIIPRAKVMMGEIVALQAVTDEDYIRDRMDRGKPVQVVTPELQSHPKAPRVEDADGVNPEDEQELQSMIRYQPPLPKGDVDYSITDLAHRWDAHKKAGTEGVIAVASPMRDLLYRFANAPGRTPKEIVSNLAESVNEAVDADLRHIHQTQQPNEEPLPDDTLIRQAKRDEELDQIDKFYHVTLGGPTVRNLVQTTERARKETVDSGHRFRYNSSASDMGDSEKTKCGPKERVVRKLLEYSKDLESGFMWRAKTGRDPMSLAASDLGTKFTLEWAASRYMRAPIEGTDERECINGPKYCLCKLMPKMMKASDTIDTVQDEEGFVGREFFGPDAEAQIRAIGKLPEMRGPCLFCLLWLQTQKVGEVEARGVMFDTQIQFFQVQVEEDGKGWSKSRCLPKVLDDGSPTGIVSDTPEFHLQDYIPSEMMCYVNGTEEHIVKCYLPRVHPF